MKKRKNKKEYWQELFGDPCCAVCGRMDDIHRHHIFYGINKKHSEEYGLVIYLCPYHHNMSDEAIHFNKELDLETKQNAERWFIENFGTIEDFRRIFGRSWL